MRWPSWSDSSWDTSSGFRALEARVRIYRGHTAAHDEFRIPPFGHRWSRSTNGSALALDGESNAVEEFLGDRRDQVAPDGGSPMVQACNAKPPPVVSRAG